MANSTSYFTSGVIITQALTTARPVGTLVLNPADNLLYRSTNATVATYTPVSAAAGAISGTVLDGTAITWGTGLDVVATANGTDLIWTQGAGLGAFRIQDGLVTSWGTGNDLVFTPNGTDVLVSGAGALRYQDSYVTSYGTGNDLILTPDGTNVVFTGAGLGLWSDAVFAIGDNGDTTKRLKFEASAITAGQTRTITMSDADLDFRTNSLASFTIADPGTGAAIPVTTSANVALTIAGPGETNTLAIPTAVGQTLHISVASWGGAGSRAITCAQAINATGNTVITVAGAGQSILLAAASVGGALRWRVVYTDGPGLS